MNDFLTVLSYRESNRVLIPKFYNIEVRGDSVYEVYNLTNTFNLHGNNFGLHYFNTHYRSSLINVVSRKLELSHINRNWIATDAVESSKLLKTYFGRVSDKVRTMGNASFSKLLAIYEYANNNFGGLEDEIEEFNQASTVRVVLKELTS